MCTIFKDDNFKWLNLFFEFIKTITMVLILLIENEKLN